MKGDCYEQRGDIYDERDRTLQSDPAPVDGFCAESGAAVSLFLASSLGIPVSTTHTITGSIMGVGSLRRLTAVRWGVAGRILWAWILTIPCSALISAATYAISVRF